MVIMESRHVLYISAAIFAVLLILALIVSRNIPLATNLVFVGIVVLFIPYTLHRFIKFRRIKTLESEFPNFLRDLAESQRAGLTLVQSMRAAAKSEYGLLTEEIKKMDNQLSWNVPLEDVLKGFAKRVESSRNMTRAIAVIDQASKSGGNIEDTIDSLAENVIALKDVQQEKSTLLNQQAIMMYAIFFIFLGISIVLIKFLVPLLQTQTDMGVGGISFGGLQANPCSQCISSIEPTCFGCHAFFAVSAGFDFGAPSDTGAYYRALFFTMILVQGIFSGLIAGQISSDSVIAGTKHSMIMVLVGVFIFLTAVRVGFI